MPLPLHYTPRFAITALRLRRCRHACLALRARDCTTLRVALAAWHLMQSITAPEVLLQLHIAIVLKNPILRPSVVVLASIAFERRDVVRRARRATRRGALQRVLAVPARCELHVVMQRRLARLAISSPSRLRPRRSRRRRRRRPRYSRRRSRQLHRRRCGCFEPLRRLPPHWHFLAGGQVARRTFLLERVS